MDKNNTADTIPSRQQNGFVVIIFRPGGMQKGLRKQQAPGHSPSGRRGDTHLFRFRSPYRFVKLELLLFARL